MDNNSGVYIIKGQSGWYKVGRTTKGPYRRLHDLQTANPLPLTLIMFICCENPDILESMLHHHFVEKRGLGEWFKLTKADLKSLHVNKAYWIKQGQGWKQPLSPLEAYARSINSTIPRK